MAGASASQRALVELMEAPRCDACLAKRAGIPPERVGRAVRLWVRRGEITRERGECPACSAKRLVSQVTGPVFGPGGQGRFAVVMFGGGRGGSRRR